MDDIKVTVPLQVISWLAGLTEPNISYREGENGKAVLVIEYRDKRYWVYRDGQK